MQGSHGDGKIRTRLVQIFAILVCLTFASAAPASASQKLVGKEYIKNYPVVGVNTNALDVNGAKINMGVSATMSQHKTNSIFLNSINICYSGPGKAGAWISPFITNSHSAKIWELAPYQIWYPGTCKRFTINKTLTKQASGEVFRVVNRVSAPTAKVILTHGFYR